MQASVSAIIGLFLAVISATPVPTNNIDYSTLDYSNVDYSKVDWDKIDYSKVDYSKVDFEHLDYSHVDWSKIDWTKATYPQHQPEQEQPKPSCTSEKEPDNGIYEEKLWKYADILFTSTYHIVAEPGQVVNASNQLTGGLKDTRGIYDIGINSKLDLICYFIELRNFRGEYQSPARTATHIHQGDRGKSGPPRIVFPNPQPVEGNDGLRRSAGCFKGPFVTGVAGSNGAGSGTGFRVEQIEQNPSNYFTDVHSSLAVPGAVRGQFV